ncbi:hypothetical protein A2625_07675 [candidate division WOR-1 bacterium RIFCSPHIGHO2_01_FULL_53_15]|uniref:Uncharacterized protein n=1 Tax=candidate division WOR-1 bacterium RIFCSPHIGHO2_01_FULL_53_15 TaxID=1802564 RepID=A0A1F4Q6N2_UNCSA|nr:MAG: hypothetical protein A2625_07675 [candidate division WOR-1 bacterium RIFCSPHIGHO2_01_FULL_53_15]OGC10547.1 MAG: hypothetical protein A3D23_01490 [candidate division WOR-1 bacterium RIFCSPHIGHO2_02_FULL_53_26]
MAIEFNKSLVPQKRLPDKTPDALKQAEGEVSKIFQTPVLGGTSPDRIDPETGEPREAHWYEWSVDPKYTLFGALINAIAGEDDPTPHAYGKNEGGQGVPEKLY